jgi:predicted nucleotidyltransferase
MVKKSTLDIVKKFSLVLKKKGVNVEKIIIYGSSLQKQQRIDSDIDVAVVSRDFGKDLTEEGMFLFRIAGDIDSRIEPVPISLDSYNNGMWLPLIYEIRKKGIELKI